MTATEHRFPIEHESAFVNAYLVETGAGVVAVDALLKERLAQILPEAGWLSEETVDNPTRLDRRLVWIVDPIDALRVLFTLEDWARETSLIELHGENLALLSDVVWFRDGEVADAEVASLQLCEVDDDGWVTTDATGRTSVPGVWAAGNVVDPRAQVITAAGAGSAAAIPLNADLTEADVRAFCRDKLTGYKLPRRIVFRDSLPKSPVGKVLRRELREEVLGKQ